MVKRMMLNVLALLGIIVAVFILYIAWKEVKEDTKKRQINREEVKKFRKASKINNVKKLEWLLEDIEYFLDSMPSWYVKEEDREEMIGIKYYVVGKLEILNKKE